MDLTQAQTIQTGHARRDQVGQAAAGGGFVRVVAFAEVVEAVRVLVAADAVRRCRCRCPCRSGRGEAQLSIRRMGGLAFIIVIHGYSKYGTDQHRSQSQDDDAAHGGFAFHSAAAAAAALRVRALRACGFVFHGCVMIDNELGLLFCFIHTAIFRNDPKCLPVSSNY